MSRSAEHHVQRSAGLRERLHARRCSTSNDGHARLETGACGRVALSPCATLERGYAIVRRGEEVVRSREQVAAGESIDVLVADGIFGARVE